MNKSIISGVVGAGFFALSLAIPLPIIPAIAIGAAAFGASEMVMSSSKKVKEVIEPTFKEKVSIARKQIVYLKDMTPKIDDDKMQEDLKDITTTSTKIINRIEENSLKNKTAKKFMDYYYQFVLK